MLAGHVGTAARGGLDQMCELRVLLGRWLGGPHGSVPPGVRSGGYPAEQGGLAYRGSEVPSACPARGSRRVRLRERLRPPVRGRSVHVGQCRLGGLRGDLGRLQKDGHPSKSSSDRAATPRLKGQRADLRARGQQQPWCAGPSLTSSATTTELAGGVGGCRWCWSRWSVAGHGRR
jgi:hypothetical protein